MTRCNLIFPRWFYIWFELGNQLRCHELFFLRIGFAHINFSVVDIPLHSCTCVLNWLTEAVSLSSKPQPIPCLQYKDSKLDYGVTGFTIQFQFVLFFLFIGLYRDVQSVCLSVTWRAEDRKQKPVDGKVRICFQTHSSFWPFRLIERARISTVSVKIVKKRKHPPLSWRVFSILLLSLVLATQVV